MGAVYTPTVRGRRLALELRRLRESTGLSQTKAALRLSWSQSKLSRIEEAVSKPTKDDVLALLQLYGLGTGYHEAILQLLKDSWKRGWWTLYGDVFSGNYVMLEDQAPEIHSVENALIPGLLQTPAYARKILRVRVREEDALSRLVEARMERKKILVREVPPTLHYVIGEGSLRRTFGDVDMMREQHRALLAVAEHPNITLQVVPFDAPPSPGLDGPFTLFGFPVDRGLDVGHAEGALWTWYAESADQLKQLRVDFTAVCSAALSPSESREFLSALTRE